MAKRKKIAKFDSGLNSAVEVKSSGKQTTGPPLKIITTQIKSKMTIDGVKPA